MAKPARSTPGDHLLDSLRAPKAALTRAAKKRVPLLETSVVAGLGMVGVGWSCSGLLLPGNNAFERFVLGGLAGAALALPVLFFVGAANALQPSGSGSAATIRQSAAITATALVGPGVVALVCGVAALAGPMFAEGDLVALLPAVVACTTWLMGLVGMTGWGHALGRSSSAVIGVASAFGALLITGLAVGLAAVIYLNPPWAKDQPWGFL